MMCKQTNKQKKTEKDRNENDQIQVKFFQDVEDIKCLLKHLQSHFPFPPKKPVNPERLEAFPLLQ